MFNIINVNKIKEIDELVSSYNFCSDECLNVVIGKASDIRGELLLEEDTLFITDDEIEGYSYMLVDLSNCISVLKKFFDLFLVDAMINIDLHDLLVLIRKNRRIYFSSSSNSSISIATKSLFENIDTSNCDIVIFNVEHLNPMLFDINTGVEIVRSNLKENCDLIFSTNKLEENNIFNVAIICC